MRVGLVCGGSRIERWRWKTVFVTSLCPRGDMRVSYEVKVRLKMV